MKRSRAVVLAVVVLPIAALVAHRASRPRTTSPAESAANDRSAESSLEGTEPEPSAAHRSVRANDGPGAGAFTPPAGTVHDRAVRDEVRRRLLAAWVEGLVVDAGESADATVPFAAMPSLDGGAVDPDYLRARIREDLVPMTRDCYEHLLAQHPGVAGRATMAFVIAGDSRVGGVVDDVSVEASDGGLDDPAFTTCLRESMYTVAFRPPPGRGVVRVRYPLRFDADPADAAR